MQKLIDLHTHSTYSDGTLSPGELVHRAKDHNIETLALTDHDTIDGIAEAFVHGQQLGIEIITGIEISAIYNDTTMHILGYGFNLNDDLLAESINTMQLARRERNKKIVEKLNKMGHKISYEELSRKKGRQTGRPHIARLLVQKGYVKNIETAFKHFLRDGGPAYEEGYKLPARDAIHVIRKAGGVSVLAHPAKINLLKETLDSLIAQLTSCGLDGIEIFYPRHSQKDIKKLRKTAGEHNLLLTGGSDFHGIMEHGDMLGGSEKKCRLPYDIWLEFKKRLGTPSSPDTIKNSTE